MSKAEFFTTAMPRPVIDELVEHLTRGREHACYREIELIPWGGRLSSDSDGAFSHRDAWYLIKHSVQTGCRAADLLRTAAEAWVTRSWSITSRVGASGCYANYPDSSRADWMQACHGSNLPRLRRIKAQYDPASLFAPPGGSF